MTVDYDAFTLRKPRKKRTSVYTGKTTTLTPELEFQISLIVYYDKRCRVDRKLRENTRLYAVNPVPGKTLSQAVLSKRMGLRAGIWDMCLLKKRQPSGFAVIWIELKAQKGQLTAEQLNWAAWLSDTPVQCHEVRSLSEFISLLEAK